MASVRNCKKEKKNKQGTQLEPDVVSLSGSDNSGSGSSDSDTSESGSSGSGSSGSRSSGSRSSGSRSSGSGPSGSRSSGFGHSESRSSESRSSGFGSSGFGSSGFGSQPLPESPGFPQKRRNEEESLSPNKYPRVERASDRPSPIYVDSDSSSDDSSDGSVHSLSSSDSSSKKSFDAVDTSAASNRNNDDNTDQSNSRIPSNESVENIASTESKAETESVPETSPKQVSTDDSNSHIPSNEAVQNIAPTESKAETESVPKTTQKQLSILDTPKIKPQRVRRTLRLPFELSLSGIKSKPVARGSGVNTTKTSQLRDSGFLESSPNGHSTPRKPSGNEESSMLLLMYQRAQRDRKKYLDMLYPESSFDTGKLMEKFHAITSTIPGWKRSEGENAIVLSSDGEQSEPSKRTFSFPEPLQLSTSDVESLKQDDTDLAEASSEEDEDEEQGSSDDQQQAAASPNPSTKEGTSESSISDEPKVDIPDNHGSLKLMLNLQNCIYFKDNFEEDFTKNSDRKRQEATNQIRKATIEIEECRAKRLAFDQELRDSASSLLRINYKPLFTPYIVQRPFVGKTPTYEEPEKNPNELRSFAITNWQFYSDIMNGGPHEQVIVSKFGLEIRRSDFHTLIGTNWVNDTILNFYINLIVERSEQADSKLPKVHAMNTFFLMQLAQKGYPSVRRWTRKVNIFEKDIILVPVHANGQHWSLCIIDMRHQSIRYYDSLDQPHCPPLSILKLYLEAESVDKRQQPFETSSFKMECAQSLPKQSNTNDCGIFCCQYAEYVSRDAPITFAQSHIYYFRHRMALEIALGKLWP